MFTDAARYVHGGDSPYARDTYRYTPLLAAVLVPCISVHMAFGKVLFCVLDLLAGWMIRHILLSEGVKREPATKAAAFWLLNPLVINVSTRGNAESIMSVLVLWTLLLLRKKCIWLCGCVYALSVHTKIYPVIYGPSLLYFVVMRSTFRWRAALSFVVAGAVTGCCLTVGCYVLYGHEFLEQSLLYHFKRVDTRHNFSPYFYVLYLSQSSLVSTLAFLPQALAVFFSAYRLRKDLSVALFAVTWLFVAMNKVLTVQYFVWSLTLLPLLLPRMRGLQRLLSPLCMWVGALAAWLATGYLVEFAGKPTFLPMWLSSMAFVCAQVYLLLRMVSCVVYPPPVVVDSHVTTRTRKGR